MAIETGELDREIKRLYRAFKTTKDSAKKYIYAEKISNLYREKYTAFNSDKEDPAAWITVRGNKIPLDSEGTAIGGRFKGKTFSKAKSSKQTEGSKDTSGGSATSRKPKNRPVSATAAAKDNKLKNYDAKAQAAYDKARSCEAKITDDMCAISEEIGATMYGLEFSVKTASSVENKIERKKQKAIEEGEEPASAEDIVKSMGDIVRYTQMCDHDKIVETTETTKKTLEQWGYKVTKLENKYTDPKSPDYKGVHLDVVSPDGQKFELQVHSELSMKYKNINHVLYEESRDVNCPKERKEELKKQMIENASKIPNPVGIEKLKGFVS